MLFSRYAGAGRRGSRFVALAALLTALATVLAAQGAQAQQLRGDGGVPAFYSWSGRVTGGPGKLLRNESLSEVGQLANAATNVRILYTSTDGLTGKGRVVVSGALYLPRGTPPRGGWPLLSWAHGTVGVADICAPSFAGRSARDVTYLNFWLAQGYAVVASDYQGLGTPGGHPYLDTRSASYSLLDSVRAVQRDKAWPLSKKVVLIGQSQGGGAAFATAAYAPAYAPDLDVRGAVATGTPYFSPAAQVALDAARPRDTVDPLLGYGFYVLSLLEQSEPGFHFEDFISDRALPLVRTSGATCFTNLARQITTAALTYNLSYKADISPYTAKAYAHMGYPTLRIKKPVFMGTGGSDRDVPPGMQLQLGADACAAGSTIEQHLYPGLDHSGTVNGSTGESSVFVRKVFAGERITGNCNARPSLPPPASGAPGR